MSSRTIVPIVPAPSPKGDGCYADPPCVGPGISKSCAWGEPTSVNPQTLQAGLSVVYVCKRIPQAELVTMSDGTPALTHGSGKVRPFRISAIGEIQERGKTDPRVRLDLMKPIFDAVKGGVDAV